MEVDPKKSVGVGFPSTCQSASGKQKPANPGDSPAQQGTAKFCIGINRNKLPSEMLKETEKTKIVKKKI